VVGAGGTITAGGGGGEGCGCGEAKTNGGGGPSGSPDSSHRVRTRRTARWGRFAAARRRRGQRRGPCDDEGGGTNPQFGQVGAATSGASGGANLVIQGRGGGGGGGGWGGGGGGGAGVGWCSGAGGGGGGRTANGGVTLTGNMATPANAAAPDRAGAGSPGSDGRVIILLEGVSICGEVLGDPANCGGAGVTCSSNHITRACAIGVCSGRCDAGLPTATRTRRPTAARPTCSRSPIAGACGHACSTNHVTPSCAGGVCGGACDSGWSDCDGRPREQRLRTGYLERPFELRRLLLPLPQHPRRLTRLRRLHVQRYMRDRLGRL